jgi:hypothetical protein
VRRRSTYSTSRNTTKASPSLARPSRSATRRGRPSTNRRRDFDHGDYVLTSDAVSRASIRTPHASNRARPHGVTRSAIQQRDHQRGSRLVGEQRSRGGDLGRAPTRVRGAVHTPADRLFLGCERRGPRPSRPRVRDARGRRPAPRRDAMVSVDLQLSALLRPRHRAQQKLSSRIDLALDASARYEERNVRREESRDRPRLDGRVQRL